MKNILYFAFLFTLIFLVMKGFGFVVKRFYFQNVPQIYNGYVLKEDNLNQDSEGGSKNIKVLSEVSDAGCLDVCYGRIEATECQDYGKNYNLCIMKCYGFMYNSCDIGLGDMFIMYLTK